MASLCADSTESLKGSEVPPPVESVHQRQKACPKSRVVSYAVLLPSCLSGGHFKGRGGCNRSQMLARTMIFCSKTLEINNGFC